jgi:acyl carrier protein
VAEQPSSFDEFRGQLAEVFTVPVESLQWETKFLEDLSFDSLRMLQLGMVFEDLHLDMPPEMAWGIRTVGDAYSYYVAAGAAAGAATPTEAPPTAAS